MDNQDGMGPGEETSDKTRPHKLVSSRFRSALFLSKAINKFIRAFAADDQDAFTHRGGGGDVLGR